MVISGKNLLNIFMNNVVGRDCNPIFKHNHPYFISITINLYGGSGEGYFFQWRHFLKGWRFLIPKIVKTPELSGG